MIFYLTMTLGQAAARGIARLRRPSWEPNKHIELDLPRDDNGNPSGYVGPWVVQREGGTEETFLIFTFNEEDDWEPVNEVVETPPPTVPDAS